MCEISKKSIKHVTSNEKSAQNTYEMEKKKSIHKYLLVMYGYVEVLVFFLLWKSSEKQQDLCSPSILIVQSMVVKKVQLVLFQRSIRMLGNKLTRSLMEKLIVFNSS